MKWLGEMVPASREIEIGRRMVIGISGTSIKRIDIAHHTIITETDVENVSD
jgi:hypothetical protein